MNTTETLAEFTVDTAFEDLPGEVIEQAKKCFLDWLGVALGGSSYPIADILTEFAGETGGGEQATIIGKGIKSSTLNVALTNGALSHVLDFDDTHLDSLCHISSPIIPAILALGEYHHVSGADCITALVLGFDISARVGMALGPDHYNKGWHATSTMGHIGATIASGKLLGLNKKQMCRALGIGATQAGGLRAVFGTMCKPLHPGKAAMDGVLSAILAGKGFDSIETILEVKDGFLQAFSTGCDPTNITKNLGNSFEICNNTFKPYASCLLTHPSIDAALRLRNARDVKLQDIEYIKARVSPLAMDVTGKSNPVDTLGGKFSLYYCIAAALVEGSVGEDVFEIKRIQDQVMSDLQRIIILEADPGFNNVTAEVIIKTINGAIHTQKIEIPRGDPRNPLSFEEIEQKYRSLAGMILEEWKIHSMVDHVKNFEDIDDVGTLMALCC